MTPYERLVIALRHGVLVKRSKQMRYAADVVHQSVRPQDDDRFTVASVEAGDEFEAVRKVAQIAAVRRYAEEGSVGFLERAHGEGRFLATIGEQQRSDDGITLRGVTISIHVWTVD